LSEVVGRERDAGTNVASTESRPVSPEVCSRGVDVPTAVELATAGDCGYSVISLATSLHS
jgi:hypothetical protein